MPPLSWDSCSNQSRSWEHKLDKQEILNVIFQCSSNYLPCSDVFIYFCEIYLNPKPEARRNFCFVGKNYWNAQILLLISNKNIAYLIHIVILLNIPPGSLHHHLLLPLPPLLPPCLPPLTPLPMNTPVCYWTLMAAVPCSQTSRSQTLLQTSHFYGTHPAKGFLIIFWWPAELVSILSKSNISCDTGWSKVDDTKICDNISG